MALAVAGSVLVVYGSLVPFHFRSLAWGDAVEMARHVPYLSLRIEHRADWVANILLFVPVGFMWLAALIVDCRRAFVKALAAAVVVLFCAGFSAAIEFTQLWFPPRTVSQNDIVAETIGGMAGVTLWLAVGQAATDWVRRFNSATRAKSLLDWLLQAYVLGLLLYSVLPLDLTIRPNELLAKYRAGRIVLIPFQGQGGGLERVWSIGRDFAVWIPLGILAATWLPPHGQSVRRLIPSVAMGTAVVVAVEIAQLAVYSRFTSVEEVLLGACGVLAGAWGVRRWLARHCVVTSPLVQSRGGARSAAWLAAAAGYAVVLTVFSCWPLETIDDAHQWRIRYHAFWAIPFARLYRASEFQAISQVLRKVLLFVPLGGLVAMVPGPLNLPDPLRRLFVALLFLLSVAVAVAIEMAQVFLPAHTPDITDVLLGAAGTGVGMFLGVRLQRARRG